MIKHCLAPILFANSRSKTSLAGMLVESAASARVGNRTNENRAGARLEPESGTDRVESVF